MGFTRFEKAYNEALATINCFLNDDSAGDLRKLTAWLMDTDANPYSFLPHEWAGSLGSAPSSQRHARCSYGRNDFCRRRAVRVFGSLKNVHQNSQYQIHLQFDRNPGWQKLLVRVD